uniref:HEAT repeat-containing protein 1 n=2 Tax=Amphimedon queenslandica TaxID=400682 RepID=A0A1X7SW09_AMPQE
MIWTAPTDTNNTEGASNGLLITEVTQVRALRIARAYLHSLDHEATIAMLSAYCPVVSSLLLPLSSPNTLIRKGAYHCIEALYSSATVSQPEDKLTQIYSSCPLLHLLDYLTTCKVSIATDPIGLQLVLQSLYSSTEDGNRRGTFPRLAPPDVPPSAKKRRGKKAESLEEGERVREAIVESLLLMIVGLERGPLYMINQLLNILSGVDIKCKLSGLLKLMKELIQKVKEHDEHTMDTNKEFSSYPLSPIESHCVQSLVQCYTPVVASWLETDPDAFEVFLSLLSSSISLSPTVPSLAALAVNQITPQFYSSLSTVQSQQSILHSVLSLMIVSSSSGLTLTAKQCLQQLPLSSEVLIAELLLEEDKLKPKEIDSSAGPATKKR